MRLNQAVLSAVVAMTLAVPGTLAAKPSEHRLDLKDLKKVVKKLKQKHHATHQWKSLYRFNKRREIDSLSDAARQSFKLAGSAASHGALTADEQYRDVLTDEFDYITPENSGKWGSLQPNSPDEWDFTAHDEMVAYAQENNKLYKGHTLVWHSQAPSFINDTLTPEELQSLIDTHIETTMTRYHGQFYAWDVVNEAIAETGEYRDSVFYRKLGADYIADAFYLANNLDHRAKLYYNDYNIAGINAKSDGVYNMLKGLVESGVPVDGIGFQMHLTASGAPSYDELVENFQRFADLGLRLNISELDVRIADLPWDHATNLAIQQQVYHRVVSACMKFLRCESVTTWGFTDAYSWVDSTFGADDPLPLDETYARKPAYFGMVNGFANIDPDAKGAMPNLIANGQMETGLDGWSSWGGELVRATPRNFSRLPLLSRLFGHKLGKSSLMVTERTESWHSAVYDILPVIRPGQSYQAEAYTRISGAYQDDVALSVAYRCEGEADVYLNLANDTSNARQWQSLGGQFDAPDCQLESASLYVEGPAAGVDLLVDGVSLRPNTLVPDEAGMGPNIVVNSDFEVDTFGWFGFGPVSISASTDRANTGLQSALIADRTANWQGPATSLYLDAEPGTDYRVIAWTQMESGNAQVNATVKATCAAGDQYILVGSASANDSSWSMLSGIFTVPECDLLDLTLYFEGPGADQSFFIDDVYAQQILSSTIDNLVSNGDFENGVAGWSAWGGSLSATSTAAHGGSQSALLATRTANWQGPGYDLTSAVVAGGFYQVNAWGMLSGVAADSLNITIKTTCADGSEQYNQLTTVTATDSDWTELNGSITLPSCDLTQVYLYFDGPAAEANILLDDVVVTGEAAPTPSNLISNPDFEAGLSGWTTWGGTLDVTSVAHSGNQAAILTARTGTWQGPVYNLLSAVEAGSTYAISGWSRIQGAASASVSITVKTVCDDGTEAYNWGGANNVTDTDWTQVAGEVTMPSCNLTEVSLYFDGPDAGVDTLLDDVSVELSM